MVGEALRHKKTLLEASKPPGGVKVVRLPAWARLLLLLLILAAFGRVLWQLDAKNLWWDESLSLQRAESAWIDLILGRLYLYDGLTFDVTHDQHPFFFFIVQGILLRLAGESEVVLRFPSVMAVTLLVPAVWSFARLFVRRGIMAAGAPLWAALLAAGSPFYLWYGQEARPYALWAVLALISTYCLVRATDRTEEKARSWWIGYAISALMFYTTHYYAVFLLPVHAFLLAQWLWARSRRGALLALAGALLVGAGVGAFAYWSVVIRQGGGGNFREVEWQILFPDLLNAFSLGKSVNIVRVWWLDLVFGALALLGVVRALWGGARLRAGGWLPLALVAGPVVMLLVAMSIYPAYMDARHMSLIGGGFLLLVAAGLAVIAQRGRLATLGAGALAFLLLAGMGYSSYNYFTMEEYAKDDFTALGGYLDRRMAPGDVVLVKSPFAWRIFTYYTNIEAIPAAQAQGAQMGQYGVPLLRRVPWEEQEAQITRWAEEYRRVWLIVSNTHPYMDVERRIEKWMNENLFNVQEITYFSHSSLSSTLYLDKVPVYEGLPPELEQPIMGVFGDLIQVVGLEVGEPVRDDLGLPVTIYWQTLAPTPDHYKYLLTLEEVLPDGSTRVLALTEREPYDGAIPTIYWQPGQTIVEYSELPRTVWPRPQSAEEAARYRISLQVYRADTLEKLPVTHAKGVEAAAESLWVPYWSTEGAGR
jgi:4-amino-4-deoxy-L-arabinose transferase-like glycosyltransferase